MTGTKSVNTWNSVYQNIYRNFRVKPQLEIVVTPLVARGYGENRGAFLT